MTALLALSLGGIWLWGLTALIFLAIVFTVESESYKITTPAVIAGVVALLWLSHYPLLAMIKAHWLTTVYALVGYLIFGVFYGGIRYWFYAHKISDKLDEWLLKKGLNRAELLVTDAQAFAKSLGLAAFPLRVGDSKQRIVFWMIYWPFSAPWTLINEPVKRFFNFAYGRISGFLQSISDRVFKDVTIVEKLAADVKDVETVVADVKTEKQILLG